MEQGTSVIGVGTSPASVKLCECGCGKPAPIAKYTNAKRGTRKGEPVRFAPGHHLGPSGRPSLQRKLFAEPGQRIGRSVVTGSEFKLQEPNGKGTSRAVRLRCDCGTEYVRRLMVIFGRNRDPDKESCGCDSGRFADRTGQRFGKLTAIRRAEAKAQNPGKTARWLCACDCGNEIVVTGAQLMRGRLQSCGCFKPPQRGYAPGEAAFNAVMHTYRHQARVRGYSWDLTREDFRRVTSLDCHYCGAAPSSIRKGTRHSGDYAYNGIDRIDNSLGYRLGNVVPACKVCNHAKRDMPYDEFLAWIARLAGYHFFRPEVMPSRMLAARAG